MTFTVEGASAPATQFWRERGSQDWARVLPSYWEAGAQPHRLAMLDALKRLGRFESLREIGCCAGTNIRLIRETFPWVACEGTEISVEAATFAQDKLAADPAVRIVCTDLFEDAPLWAAREVDVALSVYTLAYVAPEEIMGILRHILRSAAKGVLLVEPMHGPKGRIPVQYTAEWCHDYRDLIETVMADDPRQASLDVATLHAPVERCDGMVLVKFV